MQSGLYRDHVGTRREKVEAALAESGFDTLIIHAGKPFRYFADDMDAPFHSTPHFAHWVPLEGPHHLLCVRPGQKPRLVRVAPEDYWYEQSPLGNPFWAAEFDIDEVGTEEQAWKLLAPTGRSAYLGDAPAAAEAHGIPAEAVQPAALIARLDWDRSFKTPYEVSCLEEASRVGGLGHAAARSAFESGASELEIHQAFVAAAGCVDRLLPYESIVGLNEKGAILHYVGKRADVRDGNVLLIDAGARHLGYCSDITRTWTSARCDGSFRELVEGMDSLQQELCAEVRPGLPYPDLHGSAHVKIGDLLERCGVLKVSGEEALAKGLTTPFFPHGLGHFLGLQVHDVAGFQKSPSGGNQPAPAAHPFLRTTRTIDVDQVFTIEPGLYFIEMLLREHRAGEHAADFDWEVIERLMPCGGIRIEDNLLVTPDGHRNLTRPHI